MKKIILAVMLIAASVSLVAVNVETVYARSGGSSSGIPASSVPKAVKRSFRNMYPTATNVQWEVAPLYYGGNVYTAGFYLAAQKWEANYYADGTFISAAPKI